MGPFFQKDLLIFWRDRKEILTALLLPIVIIVVLTSAMSGLFNKDSSSINVQVAIVQEDDEAIGFEQFSETVNNLNMPAEEKAMLLAQAEKIKPVSIFQDFFSSPELKDWITIVDLKVSEAKELVESGEINAIIKIPNGYSYDILAHLLLGEESNIPLIIQAEKQSTELSVLQNILENFTDTLNLQFAIGSLQNAEMNEVILPQGGLEPIQGTDPFNMTQFFTIAMSSLFAMFISQTIALKTVTEKREQVFNRILITNSKPLSFLMGKVFSTFCFALLQMFMTITISQMVLDVFSNKSVEFWIGLFVIITAFALAIAGLSAIFVSISLKLHDTNAVSGITTLILMSMAVIGGNFFPSQVLPDILQQIGRWTPNGMTQFVLIKWVQYSDIQQLLMPISFLLILFFIFVIIGMSMFPKRGEA